MTKKKVRYVDGFVMIVKRSKLADYRRMATEGRNLWMKYGALDYKECVGDDLRLPHVTLTFPKLTKLKPGEIVVFSYIGYASRAHRDRVNAKVMKDPAMSPEAWKDNPMPFDMKRVSQGGFKVIVSS